jgi:hypothetical protein
VRRLRLQLAGAPQRKKKKKATTPITAVNKLPEILETTSKFKASE